MVNDFEQTIGEWQITENNFKKLQASVNTSGGRSVQIKQIIEQIHPNCKEMLDAAKQLLSTAQSDKIQPRLMLSQPLRQIRVSERGFEKEVDKVIYAYNEYTAQAVTELKQIEMALLVLTLLILILEGVLIFRTAVEQLRTTFNKLTEEQKSPNIYF